MIRLVNVEAEGNELNIIRQLFSEYEKELNEDLCFQSFEKELQDPLIKYGSPSGTLLLAYWNDSVAGCIALRPMEDGICEMKRLFVRPDFRNNKIGYTLVERLLQIAIDKGYQKMELDTLKKLQTAIDMYRKFGFAEVEPYYNSPMKDVLYMEKDLKIKEEVLNK